MDRSTERLAAASLIGECEAILKCVWMPEENALALRIVVANALSAFRMQHHDQEDVA
jgi:hypothetical protein